MSYTCSKSWTAMAHNGWPCFNSNTPLFVTCKRSSDIVLARAEMLPDSWVPLAQNDMDGRYHDATRHFCIAFHWCNVVHYLAEESEQEVDLSFLRGMK